MGLFLVGRVDDFKSNMSKSMHSLKMEACAELEWCRGRVRDLR